VTKPELVRRVSEKCHLTQVEVARVLGAALAEIGAAARRAPIRLPGFGTFRPTVRKARRIRDLATGEMRRLPAILGIGFRAAKELRAAPIPLRPAKAASLKTFGPCRVRP
jgi:DNA-binding protein HU-beta